MLSYRHGFHAGYWADVHKHVALALLLRHLGRKDKPFCVLDAFAGDGIYDLTSIEAVKLAEYRDGIGRVWQATGAPAGADWYLAQVRAANPEGRLTTYPGSPALARAALREADRLIACEAHPTAHARLRRWAGGDRRVALHRRDGFEFLGATVPPPIRRGLVLLDPSYEVKADYRRLPAALAKALAKWPQGIYAVWYPVLAAGRHEGLLAALAEAPAGQVLVCEIAPPEPPPTGMRGAGMVVLNPPWRFDEDMASAGDWIAGALWPPRRGRHAVRWLRRAVTAGGVVPARLC